MRSYDRYSVESFLHWCFFQMKAILSFKDLEDDQLDQCPCNENIQELLRAFHYTVMRKAKINVEKGLQFNEEKEKTEPSNLWSGKLMSLVNMVRKNDFLDQDQESSGRSKEGMFLPDFTASLFFWCP